MPVCEYNLHDVRIHAIKFSSDDLGFPLMMLDVDFWEMLESEDQDVGALFSVRPVILKYHRVHDCDIFIKGAGDPFLMIIELHFQEIGGEFLFDIRLSDKVSFIKFFASASEFFVYGDAIVKNDIQYLEGSERGAPPSTVWR